MVGARSRRQGTGPHVARELARAGCRVVGVVGTSDETIREARQQLADRHGIRCRGYRRLAELFDAESVDAVAICSPPEHHAEALAQVAAARCHAFCEKPLLWDPARGAVSAAEAEATARPLVEAFTAAGRVLVVNTQWASALDAFEELHPGSRAEPLPARGTRAIIPRPQFPHDFAAFRRLVPSPDAGGRPPEDA